MKRWWKPVIKLLNRHGQHNILQTWRWKVGQQNSHTWERGRADEVRAGPQRETHLASFISICWRISWRSWSLRTGKMFLSSRSCLLGRLRSFTARSSFLILRGNVPVYTHTQTQTKVSNCFLVPWLTTHHALYTMNCQQRHLVHHTNKGPVCLHWVNVWVCNSKLQRVISHACVSLMTHMRWHHHPSAQEVGQLNRCCWQMQLNDSLHFGYILNLPLMHSE